MLPRTYGGFGFPTVAADGTGGAFYAYIRLKPDFSSDRETNYHVQHISAEGELRWTPSGVTVTATADRDTQLFFPVASADDRGGVVVGWRRNWFDDVNRTFMYQNYATRVSSTGAVAPKAKAADWQLFE